MKNPVHDILKGGYDFFRFDLGGILSEKGWIYRDSMHRITDVKQPDWSEKACVLIGSGPSLTIEDLTALGKRSGLVSVACNSIFKAYEFTDWRADLYCISDEGVFDTVGKKVLEIQKDKPIFVTERIYQKMDAADRPKVIPVRVRRNVDYPQRRRFSGNAARYTYTAGSVLYFMLQLAYYLGFKKIYLLGCDCNYSLTKQADGTLVSTGVKDYFLPGYEDRKGHQPINQYDIVIPDYEEARRFTDSHGVSVFNATRGGKLESFVRVSFDQVLDEYR